MYKYILVLILVISLIWFILHIYSQPILQVPQVKSVTSDSVIKQINIIRLNNKLEMVDENSILDKTAKEKACDMDKNNYFSHQDLKGNMSWHLLTESKYEYESVGEDLAKNCIDNICLDLWMKSPAHKKIILTPEYKDVGIGRCGVYTVLHFGKQL